MLLEDYPGAYGVQATLGPPQPSYDCGIIRKLEVLFLWVILVFLN